MFCMYCGSSNSDDSKFCINCGKPLEGSATQGAQANRGAAAAGEAARVGSTTVQAAQAATQAVPVGASAPNGGADVQHGAAAQQNASVADAPYVAGARYDAQTAASGNTVYASQAYGANAYDNQAHNGQAGAAPGYAYAAAPQVKPKGCFATAWEDVRSSEGWVGKILLMGLVFLVPILSFFVPGYAAKWGGQAASGKRNPMPGKIFADGAFKLGFFAFAFGLIAALLTFFASIVLGFIPVIGAIANLALAVFMTMFVSLCIMRIAVSGRFGEGFSVSMVWEAFRRDAGGLFCASFLPGAVIGLIAFAVSGLAITIAATASGISFLTLSQAARHAAAPAVGIVFSIVLVAVIYLISVAESLSVVVTFRAVGHWVNRTAPNWPAELANPQHATANQQSQASYTSPVAAPPKHDAAPKATAAAAPVQPASAVAAGSVSAQSPRVPAQPAPSAACAQAAPAQPVPAPAAAQASAQSSVPAQAHVQPAHAANAPSDAPTDARDTSTTVLAGNAPALVLVRVDGTEVAVSAFPSTVGKGSAADIQISGNNAISRVHARVSIVEGDFAVEDMESTNKTFVNGNAIDPGKVVKLQNGDVLKLGSEELTVRF